MSEGLIMKVSLLLYPPPWLRLKMPLTRSGSHKGKRRADSVEGQSPQVSAPSGARPAKKRKLEETDALDAETLAVHSRTYSTARTKRRSEELIRRRKKARLLQRASTRVQIHVDKPKSPSPVALPTPNSVDEGCGGGDDPVAKDEAVDELTKLRTEVDAKDRVGGITLSLVLSILTLRYPADHPILCQVASSSPEPRSMPGLS